MDREFSEEEMKANYPFFRDFVYAKLKEEMPSLEPIVGGDLQKFIQEQGGVPLATFIRDIENGADDE